MRSTILRAAGMHRGAIDNARRALEEVRLAMLERAELQRVDRHGVQQLCQQAALELLERQTVGRFAYVARAGVPDVVPVNYLWSHGCVLIRSGPGPKLQAAQRGDVVAFQVDELDADQRSGCSVVVTGRASVVLAAPGDDLPEPWAAGPRRHLIRVSPDRIEGRRLG